MWETIEETLHFGVYSSRLEVPEGWIVRTIITNEYGNSVYQTFVSDPKHEWQIDRKNKPKTVKV
jgi:hypothetical protein